MPNAPESANGRPDPNSTSTPIPDGIDSFFVRNRLDSKTRSECDKYARLRFPNAVVKPSTPQGYCSYTLDLSDGFLLQFRPEAFKLDMDICSEAKAIYQGFAPATTYMGTVEGMPLCVEDADILLHVYLQEKIPGIPLSELRRRNHPTIETEAFRRQLLEDLASVFALGFHERRRFRVKSGRRTVPRGKVGSSILWRLNLLQGLQKRSLIKHESEAEQRLVSIENLPWCLTHGDLLPGNMMVDPDSGHLTGLVDWAEAEWLPFGTSLYGIEEVLGRNVPLDGFRYYEDHSRLRRLFWKRLLRLSRRRLDFGVRPWLKEVDSARKLGILLWRGIAFDDGRIDRVVEAGRDDSEIQKLEMFLEVAGPIEQLRDRSACGSSALQSPWALGGMWNWGKRRVMSGHVDVDVDDDDGGGGGGEKRKHSVGSSVRTDNSALGLVG